MQLQNITKLMCSKHTLAPHVITLVYQHFRTALILHLHDG